MRIARKGATSQSIYFVVLDSTSTTGGRKTDLVYNTTSLTAYYTRNRAAAVAITLATLAAADSAYSSGGFIAVSATNAPGLYRLDLPDAALASGVDSVVVTLKGATEMVQVDIEIQLVSADFQDTVRMGLTALPNAAAAAAGGLPVSSAGSLDLDTLLGRLDVAISTRGTADPGDAMDLVANAVDAAALAADAVTEIQSGLATASSIADLDALIDTIIATLGTPDGATVSADLLTLLDRLTATRAGYLDKLNITGNVASSSEVTAIQNNTRAAFVVPEVIERPDSGTQDFEIHLYLYDDLGNMEAPDSAPTLALTNQAGTDLSARLGSTTMTLVGTGHYVAVYTADAAHALDQLHWEASVVEGGATRQYGRLTQLVDTTAVDFTSDDRTQLQAIHGKLPSKAYLAGTGNSDGDVDMAEATGNFPGSVGSVAGNVAGSIGSLDTQAKADVNAEVKDVLEVDAQAEPTSVPAANASHAAKVSYIFAWRRNKQTVSETAQTLRNDADSADIAAAALSESGGVLTKGEDA